MTESTNVNINSPVNYPIVGWFPLPGNEEGKCLVIAKSEADKYKHFDSWLIGYAQSSDLHLSLSRICKGLEFRRYNEALDRVISMVKTLTEQGEN